jgi:uncharacterized protein (TIGR00725 family)
MAKRLQIGVIGSAGNDKSEFAEKLATECGTGIAKSGHVLVFGPELRPPSLSTIAAKAAFESGGITVGVSLGRGKTSFEGADYTTVWVYGDHAGGGAREVSLVNSCDGVIVLDGGVGTLIEVSVAYSNLVPIALMQGTGGWADKFQEPYLDSRNKVELHKCATIAEAIAHIEREAEKRQMRQLSNR